MPRLFVRSNQKVSWFFFHQEQQAKAVLSVLRTIYNLFQMTKASIVHFGSDAKMSLK